MILLKFIVILIIFCLNASPYEHTNQANWLDKYQNCGGSNQSPIELNFKQAEHVKNMVDINFVNFNVIQSMPIFVKNNGHTLNLEIPKFYNNKRECILWKLFDEVSPHICDGPFGELKYITESIHFHWGTKDNHGSEHDVNGKRYSMEMHIVHRNSKYKNFKEAINYPNGFAVLAFLYEAKEQNKDNNSLRNIVEVIKNTIKYNSTCQIESFCLATLLQNINLGSFYSYNGSLTTPPCTENVQWVVFTEPIQISDNQINAFRSLHDRHGSVIVNNYRELQMTNNRRIFLRNAKKNS